MKCFVIFVVLAALAMSLPATDVAADPSLAGQAVLVSGNLSGSLIPEGSKERIPPNVQLTIAGGQLTISWDAEPGATTYKVYSSAQPDGGFAEDLGGTFASHSWSAPVGASVRFYYVTTITGGVIDSLVFLEGGTFNNNYCNVTISSFYLDRYETTQGDYLTVMGANPASGHGEGFNYPVYNVSWWDAVVYCNRRSMLEGLTPCYTYPGFGSDPDGWPPQYYYLLLPCDLGCNWNANGYRLPTEMEWVFAARGGNLANGYLYSGSPTIDNVAWYVDNSGGNSHAVGTKNWNELTLFDMSGNVWEWVWDTYGTLPITDVTDPTGPSYGTSSLLRGGAYNQSASNCQVQNHIRNSQNGFLPQSAGGFRVARRIPAGK